MYMYSMRHKISLVMTVLPNIRLVLTISLVAVCVLNELYGSDGWFCVSTVTLGLSELLGLDCTCTLLYCQLNYWNCCDQAVKTCQYHFQCTVVPSAHLRPP